MLKTTDYIHCYENVLEADLCKSIINNSQNIDFEKATTVGKTSGRKCYVSPLANRFDKDIYAAVGKVIQMYQNDHVNFTTGPIIVSGVADVSGSA